jgi:hypothetical protein
MLIYKNIFSVVALVVMVLLVEGCATRTIDLTTRVMPESKKSIVFWTAGAGLPTTSLEPIEVNGSNVEHVVVGAYVDPGKVQLKYKCYEGEVTSSGWTTEFVRNKSAKFKVKPGVKYLLVAEEIMRKEDLGKSISKVPFEKREIDEGFKKYETVYASTRRNAVIDCQVMLYLCRDYIYYEPFSDKNIDGATDLLCTSDKKSVAKLRKKNNEKWKIAF